MAQAEDLGITAEIADQHVEGIAERVRDDVIEEEAFAEEFDGQI